MTEAGALGDSGVVIQTTAVMEEAMAKGTTMGPREATSTIKIPYLPTKSSSCEVNLRGNALSIIYLLNIPSAAARPQD